MYYNRENIEPWWLGLPPEYGNEEMDEFEGEEDEDQIQDILAEMRSKD